MISTDLLIEAAARIRDIQAAAKDHANLSDELTNRIEDAAALADDIEEELKP